MTANIRDLNYHLPSYLDSDVCELLRGIFVIDHKQRISAADILECDWLLDVGKESENVKDNQSTIFMESTDHMFNCNQN